MGYYSGGLPPSLRVTTPRGRLWLYVVSLSEGDVGVADRGSTPVSCALPRMNCYWLPSESVVDMALWGGMLLVHFADRVNRTIFIPKP